MKNKSKDTLSSFGYKWGRKEGQGSAGMEKHIKEWYVEKYFGSNKEFEKFLTDSKGKSFLDAGCGAGLSVTALFGESINSWDYTGVDASTSLVQAKKMFSKKGIKGEFIKQDITKLKINKKFDIIFCEGVLHHTAHPWKSLKNLVSHLKPNGKLLFYVYKKKAPVREFTDDYIREKLSHLSNEKAWKQVEQLNILAKELGAVNQKIKIKNNIDLLEIPKGCYSVQRLFYWFFCKAFYHPDYSDAQLTLLNFDWYKPLLCFRFTPAEVKKEVLKNKLKLKRLHVDESGITVVASK